MTDQKVAPLGDDVIPVRTARGAGATSARHARRSPSAAPETGGTGSADRGTSTGSPGGDASGAVRDPAARPTENAPGSGVPAPSRQGPANAGSGLNADTAPSRDSQEPETGPPDTTRPGTTPPAVPGTGRFGSGARATPGTNGFGPDAPAADRRGAGAPAAEDATPTLPSAALNAWAKAPFAAASSDPESPSVATRWDTPVISDVGETGAFRPSAEPERAQGGGADADPNAATVTMATGGLAVPSGGVAMVSPCANCGRPIPQPEHGSRTVRYCQDNGGACGEVALRRREQNLDAPGLTGQVAWAWAMVDRLEGMTERLAGSLASELSVAGFERQVAGARAEAMTQAAAAEEERDAARHQAETAMRQASMDRARAESTERDAAAARAAAEQAVSDRDTALRDSVRMREAYEQAEAARVAAENERDRVLRRERDLLETLEGARSELVELHGRVSESEKIIEVRRTEATAARRATEDLRAAVREAETKRGQAVADRDQIQARLQECEQHKWQLARAVEDLRATIAGLTVERDAARGEADRARRRVDAFSHTTTPRTGTRWPVEQEPPTGLHPLNGMHLPPAG